VEADSGAGHRPVMVAEVLEYLAPEKGKVIVDGTLGAGGHAEAIAARISPGGRIIGLDRDPTAVAEARKRLDPMGSAVSIHRENYRDLQSVLDGEGLETVDGILLDLGLSSMQVDDPDRGFSFRSDGPLDMRMGPDATRSAEEIVNSETEQELARIIFRYGDERWARRIAQFIVDARERHPLKTTRELSKVVEDAVPVSARRGRKHPARKTFQALRVAVNNELEDLREGINAGVERLAPSGRIVVLSYQSHEDRLVKRTFNSLAGGLDYPPGGPLESPQILDILTRKPVRASQEEVDGNPRARSAKLRAAERRGA